MQKLKLTTSLIILTTIVFSLVLEPLTVRAQTTPGPEPEGVKEVILESGICTASAVLARFLQGLIFDGIKALANLIGIKWTKFLGLDKVPIKDESNDQREELRYYILEKAAKCTARAILNNMTGRMMGVVRTSGRDGRRTDPKPAFIRDWRQFLTNAQQRGENLFRSVLNSTTMCSYFDNKLKTTFKANNQPYVADRTNIRTRNIDPFTLRARCTMIQGWTVRKYTTDFAGNGGWEALVRLAEPQNNYYGAFLMSASELSAQRDIEEEADKADGVANLGFQGRRGKAGDDCLIRSNNSRCIVYKEILTPGSTLQQTASSIVQNELSWLTNIRQLEDLISNMTGLVLSRILDLSKPGQETQENYPGERFPGLEDDTYGDGSGDTKVVGGDMNGTIFLDTNFNGILDPGEVGIGGGYLVVSNKKDGNDAARIDVDGNGNIIPIDFEVYKPDYDGGWYVIRDFAPPGGYYHTTPSASPYNSTNASSPLNFGVALFGTGPGPKLGVNGVLGNQTGVVYVTFAGSVFDDTNLNGIRDASEGGAQGAIQICYSGGATCSYGAAVNNYFFEENIKFTSADFFAGSYTISTWGLPAGWRNTGAPTRLFDFNTTKGYFHLGVTSSP